VILLDEIEKAHPSIYNILLQVLDEGQLTDGLGNIVDFRNTLIIMTSNIGARYIQKGGRVGFQNRNFRDEYSRMQELVMSEVKKIFTPEFLNRLDEIIVFNMLSDEDLVGITYLLVEELNEIVKQKRIKIELSEPAAKWLVNRFCQDRTYGARPLRRAIQSQIEDLLTDKLIRGEIKKGKVIVNLAADSLVLEPEKVGAKKKSRPKEKVRKG
jgi:ATP-dependent Clp protease ATP-binding subunit ClpC